MNIEYEHLIYSKEDNPNDLFKFCLDNKLYKDDDNNGFISRLKKLYLQNELTYEGVSTVIAYHEDNPIGICLLEDRHNENNETFHTQAGITHLDNRNRKNIWKQKYDFHFIHTGFMSFFVKEEYRNQGIANELLYEMENLIKERLDSYNLPSNIKDNMGKNYLVVTAREKAFSIIEKSTILSPIDSDTYQYSYSNDISKLTYNIQFMEMREKNIGENMPEYQNNNKPKRKI